MTNVTMQPKQAIYHANLTLTEFLLHPTLKTYEALKAAQTNLVPFTKDCHLGLERERIGDGWEHQDLYYKIETFINKWVNESLI